MGGASATTGPSLDGVPADEIEWTALTAADVPRIAALATRCLAADGGLPLAAGESFLGRRFAGPDVRALGAVVGGAMVAAGAVRVRDGDGDGDADADGATRASTTAFVDPAWRGRGFGARLLDWCLATGRDLGDRVVVETESLTSEAAGLFAGRGLRQVFAEDILRFDLASQALPEAPLPGEVTVAEWTPELVERFFAAYRGSFADRPGFPGWSAGRWIKWIAADDDFRPQWSLLATVDGEGDVAFIACAQDWVVQVGVLPGHRGRGLGPALVVEALRRMRSSGATEALLDVNVNNPAGRLYRRLGFADVGRRARYA
jgi:ribosomal protein S18 acetylase RimI-like enzyme